MQTKGKPMPKFTVELEITDRHSVTIEAENEEEARQIAEEACAEQDDSFGPTFDSSTGFTAQHCQLVQE
jgi:hypothetical protein